ncbi:hypothetical protein K502DRAFT_324139 [Neoconidiobolus thromboides FSU 785]|nr:hypothetical protein K502DRAFT_324139 [Neoconidiobolus thromboides FSU 785]
MFHQLVTSISETIVQNQLLETNFNTVKKLSLAEDTVKQLSVNNGESNVNELISENIAKLGENLILRRSLVSQFEIENQDKVLVATHAHNGIGNNGKIGGYIVIRVKGDVKDQVKLDKINKQLARHVVGLNPLYLSSNEEAVILKKDSMTAEEYQQYLNENVLLNQNFLFSNGTVLEFLKSIEKELNIKLEILTYSRLMAGEGVEKVETVDFRDEVMKQVEKFN